MTQEEIDKHKHIGALNALNEAAESFLWRAEELIRGVAKGPNRNDSFSKARKCLDDAEQLYAECDKLRDSKL